MQIARLTIIVLIAITGTACATSRLTKPSMGNSMDVTMGTYETTGEANLILVTMTQDAHRQLTQGGRISREDTLPPLYATFLARLARQYGITRVADWPLNALDIRCFVFRMGDNASPRFDLVTRLAAEDYVESAQPMNSFTTLAGTEATPGQTVRTGAPQSYDDPYLDLQHGLTKIKATESHRWATGTGIRVAVIDTGLDTEHVDLKERVFGTVNFVDRDKGKFEADRHGTAVAGVIAATANNGSGMVGVAPDAEVVALKACWQADGSGSAARCNSFTLAKALNFAIQQRVDIINLSLGGPQDPILERLVRTAIEQDILVVAAADPAAPDQFAVYIEDVIGVTDSVQAALRSGRRFIAAPGDRILTAVPGNDFDFLSGSSISAAHVSGIASLIRQRQPQLSGADVARLIRSTAQRSSGTADACQALARVIGSGDCAVSKNSGSSL